MRDGGGILPWNCGAQGDDSRWTTVAESSLENGFVTVDGKGNKRIYGTAWAGLGVGPPIRGGF